MQDILLFLDLDDTLFQTHRKDPNGSIPATTGTTLSYKTPAQQAFWDCFYDNPRSRIIPVTARDHRQYHNTVLSRDPRIDTAVLYYAGQILRQGQPDPAWAAHIQTDYAKLSASVAEVHAGLQAVLAQHGSTTNDYFKSQDVDGYYATLKAHTDCPPALRDQLFAEFSACCPADYQIHRHERVLSLLPHFLDKQHAVAYLIAQIQPSLSLGAGDSLSDLPFMGLCDFRILPKRGPISAQLWPAR